MGAHQQLLTAFGGSGGGLTPAIEFQADAGLGLSNNDPVATWADQSGNGNDATQSTAGAKPTFKSAGGPGGTRPCVDFDGGDFLSLTSTIAGQDLTIFAVFKYSDNNPRTIISGDTRSFQFRTYLNKMNGVKSGIADLGSSSTTLSSGTFYSGCMVHTGSTSLAFYLSGSADGTGSGANLEANIAKLGRNDNSSGSEYFLGSICMVKLYTSILNSTQIAAEFSAISSRWGV